MHSLQIFKFIYGTLILKSYYFTAQEQEKFISDITDRPECKNTHISTNM